MCPFCLASIGLIVASATSAGGLTALAVKLSQKKKPGPEVADNSSESSTTYQDRRIGPAGIASEQAKASHWLPPRPRKGEDSYEVWFGFNQSTFGGFLFHRSALPRRISAGFTSGLPGPRSCDKQNYTQKPAPYIPVVKNGALRRIW